MRVSAHVPRALMNVITSGIVRRLLFFNHVSIPVATNSLQKLITRLLTDCPLYRVLSDPAPLVIKRLQNSRPQFREFLAF